MQDSTPLVLYVHWDGIQSRFSPEHALMGAPETKTMPSKTYRQRCRRDVSIDEIKQAFFVLPVVENIRFETRPRGCVILLPYYGEP